MRTHRTLLTLSSLLLAALAFAPAAQAAGPAGITPSDSGWVVVRQRVTVRCFAVDGTPRDSAFSLAYTK